MIATATDRITKTPGVCGGKACIAGSRIRVQDIARKHEQGGMSADAIADELPGITLADIYAALSYYHSHRDEIAEEIRRGREIEERYRAQFSRRSEPAGG